MAAGQEPVRPLFSELAGVSEHDRDFRVAHLQTGKHVGEPGTGDVLELEQRGVATFDDERC